MTRLRKIACLNQAIQQFRKYLLSMVLLNLLIQMVIKID